MSSYPKTPADQKPATPKPQVPIQNSNYQPMDVARKKNAMKKLVAIDMTEVNK